MKRPSSVSLEAINVVEPPTKKYKPNESVLKPIEISIAKQDKDMEKKEWINLYKINNKLNYDKITSKVTHLLCKKKFSELENYLCGVPNEIISDIFESKFYSVMKVIFASKVQLEEFNFMIKQVPPHVVANLFKQQDYGILKSFLFRERCAENLDFTDEGSRQHRVDKFRFLIETIGINAVKNIVDKEEGVSQNIKEDFKKSCVYYIENPVFKL